MGHGVWGMGHGVWCIGLMGESLGLQGFESAFASQEHPRVGMARTTNTHGKIKSTNY